MLQSRSSQSSSALDADARRLSLSDQISVQLAHVVLAARRAARTPGDGMLGLLADEVAEFIRSHPCRVPDAWLQTDGRNYRRIELWRDPALGCQILAMVWPAGAHTPIHDHGGSWGIEAVWAGELQVAQFDMTEASRNAVRLAASNSRQFRSGELLTIQPPDEIHLCRNPSAHSPTVSLHVYAQALDQMTVYEHVDADWYRLERRPLASETCC